MTLGIDVSKWQATTPSLSGLDFLFARASVGLASDTKYQMHIANARAAGLVVGAYHFAYSGSIAAQAAIFLAAAGDVDFYFVDIEGKQAPTQAETKSFIDACHKVGKPCGLYHSDSGYFQAGQDYNWVAKWSPTPPSRHWNFWQYQGSPLDKDRFNGTVAQLRALAHPETGADVPTPSSYIPGYTAFVKKTGNIRSAPTLTATIYRVSAGESWLVTCWEKGQVDPADGSDQWLVQWANNRWEYTAHSNITTGPTAPAGGDCSDEVKAATDPLNAQIAQLQTDVTNATLAGAQAEWDRQYRSATVAVNLAPRP